ncbi:hypothetical protein FKP32DRAFT_1601420 [Trametes sanguinea]|nr:hypothetical protein FKP32DRAFT_1601420 [Trametes sanguinea]
MTSRKHKAPENAEAGSSRANKRSRTSDADLESEDTLSSMPPSPSDKPEQTSDDVNSTSAEPNTNNADNDPTLNDTVALSVHVPNVRVEGRPVDLTDLAFRPSELNYVPADALPRILSIVNFTEPDANRFNVGLVPLDCAWGPSGDGSGLDRFLCHNGRPVTVWMVGVVTSTWLAPTEGTRISIGVRLLCQRDLDAAKFFQFRMSNPHGDTSYAGLSTFAKRYLTSRGEPQTFTDTFDGRDRLVAWSAMPKLDANKINKSDIVVVECYVKRFKITRDHYNWQQWGVAFELLRIAQILRGPGPPDIVPDDSHVSL